MRTWPGHEERDEPCRRALRHSMEKCHDMTTITDRIDATTRIPPRFLRADPPAPRSVKIEISPRCNYHCGFCALRTREKQPKGDMDFGLFKRITREMREAG